MESQIDRRRHPRARVKVRIELKDPLGGRAYTLHTVDLSAGGAHCKGLSALPPGTTFEACLYLPLSEAGRDIDIPIHFQGSIVRQPAAGEVAIHFDVMAEGDRDDIHGFLLDSMADDSLSYVALAQVS